MDLPRAIEGQRIAISPAVYAEIVSPGSRAYAEATRLQADRFGRVSSAKGTATPSYTQTTDYAPQRTVPIVVRRERLTPLKPNVYSPGELLGTARLELPGATLIETMIRLVPGSAAAEALRSGRAAEIGAFATAPDADKVAIIDTVDAILSTCLWLAREAGIEWLWIFPRNGLMSLLGARIPGLVPPLRFARCSDVAGWNEGSDRLREFRSLGLKGLGDTPAIYQIRREDLAADVARRLALLPERHARAVEVNQQFLGAMCVARRAQNAPVASSLAAAPRRPA